jgi:hypothetical protein
MMKHLQDPAPSVLNERTDVPAAVGIVVARALEKKPENRYETAGDLVEDFTIAAGMESIGSGLPQNTRLNSTTRPAVPNLSDEPDEETLVRSRVTTPMAKPRLPPTQTPMVVPVTMPAPAPSFNPWKILIPSMVGLLVIFGVVFALSRSPSSTTETPPTTTLAADPNGQPVEAASPPTGAPESGIPAGGVTNPNEQPSPSPSASPSPSPSPDPNAGGANTNDNTNENSNTKKAPVIPVPSPKVEDEPPPSPSPTPTKAPQLPKQTPPPGASPSTVPPQMD